MTAAVGFSVAAASGQVRPAECGEARRHAVPSRFAASPLRRFAASPLRRFAAKRLTSRAAPPGSPPPAPAVAASIPITPCAPLAVARTDPYLSSRFRRERAIVPANPLNLS